MRTEVELPTLHADQVKAFLTPGRFKAVRCGRRWGKTEFGKTVACDGAIKRQSIGFFAPEYKFISEAYNEIVDLLAPVKRSSSKTDGVIRTRTGGRIDFWSLENDRAGRSRKYHKVIIDEAAFTKSNMMDIWRKSIRPTLLDYRGSALVLSNTNGVDPENFLWRICNEPEHGFVEYHAPTHANPFLPADELDKLQTENHPLVYQQEYLANFVDWRGVAFFALGDMLVNDQPVEYPSTCDAVMAIIDTAVKTGSANDGTGVSYWARSRHTGHPLICLDWDYVQIEGALLETWIPNVFRRCEELAKGCGARFGSKGAFIEDAASGSILLQQCALRGYPATALPQELTSSGKDARAINVSGQVYQKRVKFSRHAYDKVVTFKGATRNHMISQVVGFRIGDKDAAKRADDLLDTFTYAVAINLGNAEGIA